MKGIVLGPEAWACVSVWALPEADAETRTKEQVVIWEMILGAITKEVGK